jgi:hypothetical protein
VDAGIPFDEEAFYRAIANSGARALLIGRRALIALGIPVATYDYDFWIHIDDSALLNKALEPLEFWPTRTPEEARRFGRYKLENHETVDVLVSRGMPTIDGRRLTFEEAWSSRIYREVAPGVKVALPSIERLIDTKKFGHRPKDADDIKRLLDLKEDEES